MRTARLLSLLLAMALSSVAPLAPAQDVVKAPDSGMWVSAVLALLLIVVVAIASFLSPRRGHQD